MRIKRVIAIVLCLLIFGSNTVLAVPEDEVTLSAKSAVLMEASTGEILYAKNCDEQMKMASTTKIMTALIIIENCDLDEVVEIMPEATGIEGSSMYLKAGEKLTVKELLYGLMLRSGNDAAAALACYCSGSIEAFAELMNARAERLGLSNTHFENPHGLDAEKHYSTAADLAKIAAEAYQYDIFSEIVGTKGITIGTRTLTNHNKLLSMYPDADGVKTGYTKSSGRSLVSSAQRDDMRLIAVTLNAPDDWNDHMLLLDYGFENYQIYTACEKGERIATLPVISGQSDEVSVLSKETLRFVVKKDDMIKQEIVLPKFVYAPVNRERQAGILRVTVNDKYIGETDLDFDADILLKEVKSKWERFLERFGL